MRRLSLFACTLVFGSLLTGCESLQRTDSLIGSITPYRIDIVQGNAVTREQAAQIKPGLSRLQAVSYTHLDVYKRQSLARPQSAARCA